MTTAFARLQTIRNAIHWQASEDKNALVVTVNGLDLEISDQRLIPFQFSIPRWGLAAAQAMLAFKNAVELLIPSGMAMEFPLSQVLDDFTPHSPHRLAENQIWLRPIQTALFTSFFHNDQEVLNNKKGQKWLDDDQNVLRMLAIVVYMTTGICPSVTQTRVRFDSEGVYSRDLFLLADGTLIFNNHVSSVKHDKEVSPNLLALPQDLTQHLMYYLYALRPLGIQILEVMGRVAPLYSSEIWAHTTRQQRSRNSWRWTTMDFDKHVMEFTSSTFGAKISPGSIRRIAKEVFDTEFPELFLGPTDSPVDDVGQHQIRVSWAHYGRSLIFPSLANIVGDQAIRFLSISQMWQALFQIGPVSEVWRGIAMRSELFMYGNLKLKLASATAIIAIQQHYGIHSGPFSDEAGEMARATLLAQSFLFGDTVSSFKKTLLLLLRFSIVGKQRICW